MHRSTMFASLFAGSIAMLAFAVARDAWPWIADDTFISLRYADNLLRGDGLVWNAGERVEGYSNLSWVLLCAGLALLGLDLVTAARVLAIAATVGTLAVLSTSRVLPATLPARLVVVLLAAQSTVAVWAIAGLEAPLAMLLVALAMLGLERAFAGDGPVARRWLTFAGLALALLAWTRPDGPLWSAVAAATAWWFGRRERRVPLLTALLLLPLLAVAAQLAFRLAYYGDWLPNTGRAKAGSLAECLPSGWDYLRSGAWALRSLLLPAGLGALLGWRQRQAWPQLCFAVLGVLVWCLYVARVGGDVFPRNRLLTIVFAPLCVLAAHGVAAVAAFGRGGRIAGWALVLGCIGLARVDAEAPANDTRQQLSHWEGQAMAVGDWLGRAFTASQPLVAVDAAGAVPFFSRLPSLDMLGLCDRTIARTPVSSARGFIVGHNRGNGAYVLSRRPDLVLFAIPGIDPLPHWKSGVEMIADPSFFADYRLGLFEFGARDRNAVDHELTRFVAWLRLDGRAGLERQADRVVVPGYLLASWRQPFPLDASTLAAGADWLLRPPVVGVLAADGAHAVAEVLRPGRLTLTDVQLGGGRWQARADDAPPGVGFELVDRGHGVFDLVATVPDNIPLPFRITAVALQRSE